MFEVFDESRVPAEQRYLRVEGIVAPDVREMVLPGVDGTKPDEPLFFISYAYADVPIGKEFDVVLSASDPSVREEKRVKIERVTQQFSKPFPSIPGGWKTICCFGFPDGVPNLLANLPVVESWFVSSRDDNVLICNAENVEAVAASWSTSNKFKELCEEIVGEPQMPYERLQQAMFEIRLLGDVSAELHGALYQQLSKKNWGGIHRLIGVAHYFPSPILTEILCQLLDNHKDRGLGENIADLLFDIADPSAVPSLVRAIDDYEPGDDDRHLSRKIIWALGKIGTPEAIDGIKLGLENDDQNIREAARQELDRLAADR